jgi:membrane fusion protein, multidrug efflux system
LNAATNPAAKTLKHEMGRMMGQLLKVTTGAVSAAAIWIAVVGSALAEDLTARGVIQALTEATVAIDYTARVKKLPFLEGQSFKTGDVLIVFDCRKNLAEVSAAKAGARAQALKVETNRKLLARGAIGESEVQISIADLEKSKAEIAAVQARTGSCDFRAPFNGRLVERIVQEHETPSPNQPLIKIVDMNRLEIEAIIPSKWLSWAQPGTAFTFQIDETGENLSAKIVRMGATIDPVSQTIKAYGVMIDKSSSVLPGMSGTASFQSSGS